jgi:uncharacterized protein DUF3291
VADFHIAQVNVGRVRAPLDDPSMKGFVDRLDDLNALADASPGFVWRLQTPDGNATYLRPYPEDERRLVNLSVWESVDALRWYVYKSGHAELLKHRHEWFEPMRVYLALWWVPAGHRPGVDEAKQRLAHLEAHGPSPFAFTFKTLSAPDAAVIDATDWDRFTPCRAGGQ